MNDGIALAGNGNATTLARKSWTAYVRLVLITLVLLAVAVPLAFAAATIAGVAVLVLVILYAVYNVMSIRSYHLYCDDLGVWLDRGVLPWSRGVVGVKWRDIDEAQYFPNFSSWLFKSYAVRIGHRFTKSSEIRVSHMVRGNEAAMKVNSVLADLLRGGRLTG